MDEEWEDVWEPIVEFPTYAVSYDGWVLNEQRDRFLMPSRNGNGTVKVGLVKEGKQYTRAIKVLVAEAFVKGRDEIFDAVIQLDGDPLNVRASNLMWRPRWFAIEYQKQFHRTDLEHQNDYIGPIREINSGNEYLDVYQAGIIHGLLFKDIRRSIIMKDTVFPTFMRFEMV